MNNLLPAMVIFGLLVLIPSFFFFRACDRDPGVVPTVIGTTTLNHGSVSPDRVPPSRSGSEATRPPEKPKGNE